MLQDWFTSYLRNYLFSIEVDGPLSVVECPKGLSWVPNRSLLICYSTTPGLCTSANKYLVCGLVSLSTIMKPGLSLEAQVV